MSETKTYILIRKPAKKASDITQETVINGSALYKTVEDAEHVAGGRLREYEGKYIYEVWEATPHLRLELPTPTLKRTPICN